MILLFIAHDNGRYKLPVDFGDSGRIGSLSRSNEFKVTVLRNLAFFYAEQKITLGELREVFTEKAIITCENDGYIKIEKNG